VCPTSRMRAEPFLAMMAMSEVGSLSGITGSACVVNTTRPSKKGGFVSAQPTYHTCQPDSEPWTTELSAGPLASPQSTSQHKA
jgi:hypothetical protein